ncbi:MAG TPA: hypothetical protein VMW48_10585, partial [Vicinamibacterales bacterium]|nr:hypothetical protein [Vicinamibacterales bacterium]
MVTSVSQSFNFAAVRLNVSVRPAAASASTAAATAGRDRATLSPAATAQAEAGPAEAAETPVVPVASLTRAERQADALFGALDADQDGAITEQEFTEGAAALLRRAGHRHRARGGDGDDHRSERGAEHGGGRLHRKLEKAFARVDANQDGSIDKDELTAALAAAKRPERGQGAFPAPPADPAPPGAPNAPGTPADPPAPGAPGAPGAPVQGGGTSVSFTFT